MNAGKIVGLEVCGAMNLQECWDYVDTYENESSCIHDGECLLPSRCYGCNEYGS